MICEKRTQSVALMKRPRGARRVSLCAALPLVAAVVVVPPPARAVAASPSSPEVISGPSPYASCSTPGNDTLYHNAAVEPSIATNPATIGTNHGNLIAVWEQDPWAQINAHGLEAAYSFDGGKTWALAFQFNCNGAAAPVTALAVAPDDSSQLWAAGGCGVAYSERDRYGAVGTAPTWHLTTMPDSGDVWNLAVATLDHRSAVRRVYACNGNNIYASFA